jgi:hypothetical protein
MLKILDLKHCVIISCIVHIICAGGSCNADIVSFTSGVCRGRRGEGRAPNQMEGFEIAGVCCTREGRGEMCKKLPLQNLTLLTGSPLGT